MTCWLWTPARTFLSTLSLRRATIVIPDAGISEMISIHALLAESDVLPQWRMSAAGISIHALLAESDYLTQAQYDNAKSISIHALLAESDPSSTHTRVSPNNFYPRSPCGERQRAQGVDC